MFNNNKKGDELNDLHEAFILSPKTNLLFFRNKFNETRDQLSEAPNCVVAMMGLSYYHMNVALFTGEKSAIAAALDQCSRSITMFEKYRYRRKSIGDYFKKTDSSSYTDLEAHIEMQIGEINFMHMLLTFMGDQSLLAMVRAASCLYKTYSASKTCDEIYHKKKSWQSTLVRDNFLCGHCMGWGFTNLIMSHLPDRVVKVVGFFGMDVSREVGLDYLHKATSMTDTLRYRMTVVLVCLYNFYVEQCFGLGEADLEWIKEIVDHNLTETPDSAFDLFFSARYHQLSGETEKAIKLFHRSIAVQDEYKKLHNVSKWDLIWCYALNRDWQKAADVAFYLKDNSDWSPSTNAYQYASFLLMIMETDKRIELKSEVDEAMASVESLRTRYGGKTLPVEKFAITMAKRYCDGDREMPLQAFTLLYIWNVYGNCKSNHELLTPFLELIEKKLGEKPTNDARFVLLLLKGAVLKNQLKPKLAIECFQTIVDAQQELKVDTYVAPHAALELGLSYLDLGDYVDAKSWLERARDKYTGFLVESLVHLRIHGALQKLKRLQTSTTDL